MEIFVRTLEIFIRNMVNRRFWELNRTNLDFNIMHGRIYLRLKWPLKDTVK